MTKKVHQKICLDKLKIFRPDPRPLPRFQTRLTPLLMIQMDGMQLIALWGHL